MAPAHYKEVISEHDKRRGYTIRAWQALWVEGSQINT